MAASAFATLAISFSEKIGVSLVVRALGRVNPAMLFPRRRYKKRLSEKLIQMPFLFGDMNLSARDDYVALDVLTIPDGKLRPSLSTKADFSGPMPKFEAYRRAFVFGGGGYGKTTLFRNLALQCLEKRPWQKLFGRRGLLPIYLPLKVVKTSSDFPVIEAIQKTDPYFEGERGLKRLIRLGSSGRLVLLLDGYDEMPYTGGFNHVRRELEFIFERNALNVGADGLRSKNAFEKSKYWPAYKAIRESRIYLSSRLEFFEYNSVAADVDVQRWLVKGLEDRRIELVNRIFEKYRARTLSSSGRDLYAELFLQELTKTGDAGVIELSKSPLFLTVMCYVYVMDSGSGGARVFSLGASDLSKTCIRLLLEDLDEYKSRDFSAAERKAIQNRRSAYADEKYAFLSFFAVKLYELGASYFEESFVATLAVEFFSTESRSQKASEILRGLEFDDATCNLVKQIILSGLFVLVEKRDEVRYFDFPHRKFREALAVDYFNDDDRVRGLLNLLTDKSYAELILVFVEQSSRRTLLLQKLVLMVCNNQGPYAGELLVDAMRRLPKSDAERLVMELFDAADANPSLLLPVGILDFFSHGVATWRYVRVKLIGALEDGCSSLISRWAAVAARVNRNAAIEEIERFCDVLQYNAMHSLVASRLFDQNYRNRVVLRFLALAQDIDGPEVAAAQMIKIFYLGRSEREKSIFADWCRNEGGSLALQISVYLKEEAKDIDWVVSKCREAPPAFLAN